MPASPAEAACLALQSLWAVDHANADYGTWPGYHDLTSKVFIEDPGEVGQPRTAPAVYLWMEREDVSNQDVTIGDLRVSTTFGVAGYTRPQDAGLSTTTPQATSQAAFRLRWDLVLGVSWVVANRLLGLTSTPLCGVDTLFSLTAVNGDHITGIGPKYGVVMGTVTVTTIAQMKRGA